MIEFSQDPGSELVGFGRNLVEIVPRSLPELFKQLGDQNNNQKTKLSQQRTLTEGGLEFKAANQCSDFLNQFRKSPDVYGV